LRSVFPNGAPVFSNILSSNANIAVHFHFSAPCNANFNQSHFIHSINCVLLKSLGPLYCDTVGRTADLATVSAQLAQIAGPPRLKLTIVPSAKVEL
jgi:hypothetical protein